MDSTGQGDHPGQRAGRVRRRAGGRTLLAHVSGDGGQGGCAPAARRDGRCSLHVAMLQGSDNMARTLFRAGKLGARKPRPIERSVHELRRHIAVASREHTRCLMAGNYVGADMWLYIRNNSTGR